MARKADLKKAAKVETAAHEGAQLDQVMLDRPKIKPKKEETDKLVLNFSGKNMHGDFNPDRKKYLRLMSESEGTKMTTYILQLIDDDMRKNHNRYENIKTARAKQLIDEAHKYI